MTNDSESAIHRMMEAGMTRAEAEQVIASMSGGSVPLAPPLAPRASEAFKPPPIDPEVAAARLAAEAARAVADLAEESIKHALVERCITAVRALGNNGWNHHMFLDTATGRYTKSINELTELAKEVESVPILRARIVEINAPRPIPAGAWNYCGIGLLPWAAGAPGRIFEIMPSWVK